MHVTLFRWPLIAFGIISLIGLSACSEPKKMEAPVAEVAPAPPPSLYDRLGGKPAITAVVDDFVLNVAKDKRINRYFRKAHAPHFRMELVDQICQASGGPCQYTGKSMTETHKGMHVTDAAWSATVEDLRKSLDKNKVPEKEQGELIAILAPMKSEIVQVPAQKPMAAKKPVTHKAGHTTKTPADRK
jgi:hemoglobin